MKRFIAIVMLLSSVVFASVSYAGVIELVWTPNKESDLEGYKVYRGTGTCATGTLAPLIVNGVHAIVLAPKAIYKDETVPTIEGDVCYEVTAYDFSGNESPRSNRAVKTIDLVPPVGPRDLTVKFTVTITVP
jgi:hypothetical protein